MPTKNLPEQSMKFPDQNHLVWLARHEPARSRFPLKSSLVLGVGVALLHSADNAEAEVAGMSLTEQLPTGMRVRIACLAKRSDLNGRTGRVSDVARAAGQVDAARRAVEIEQTPAESHAKGPWNAETLSIKVSNLTAIDEEPEEEPKGEGDGDPCPICREPMQPQNWQRDHLMRMVCCDGQLCKACHTKSLRRNEDLTRQVGELRQKHAQGQLSCEEVARLAKPLVDDLELMNRCILCRSPLPTTAEESFKAVRRHALRGKMWAEYMLGSKYERGTGVRKDPRLAFRWFAKAAAQPDAHSSAKEAMGVRYLKGEGTRQDFKKALPLLQAAAEEGHAMAMFNLGVMHDEGMGVERSPAMAFLWYTRGAELGSHHCMSNLGGCYEKGEGVEQSDRLASQWFLKAAEAGNATAQYNYGGVLFRAGDVEGAIRWCMKAAAQGDEDAIEMLRGLGHPAYK